MQHSVNDFLCCLAMRISRKSAAPHNHVSHVQVSLATSVGIVVHMSTCHTHINTPIERLNSKQPSLVIVFFNSRTSRWLTEYSQIRGSSFLCISKIVFHMTHMTSHARVLSDVPQDGSILCCHVRCCCSCWGEARKKRAHGHGEVTTTQDVDSTLTNKTHQSANLLELLGVRILGGQDKENTASVLR